MPVIPEEPENVSALRARTGARAEYRYEPVSERWTPGAFPVAGNFHRVVVRCGDDTVSADSMAHSVEDIYEDILAANDWTDDQVTVQWVYVDAYPEEPVNGAGFRALLNEGDTQ